MKKLNKYQLRKVSKNLDYFFNLATNKDIASGKDWYKVANKFCTDNAAKYNTSPLIVASIVSALSPRNRWENNLKDALKVLQAVQDGKQPEQIRCSTFHRNKFKAFLIAKGLQEITEDSRKTYNFVRNIAYLDPQALTIDIWHLRACLKEFKSIGSANIGKTAYEQIKSLTIKKAQKLGLKGFELQAIIWLSIQTNINSIY
tara:strand:+ start:884 stop:1486 length:603 start_codon:yes stop_codon:yes gene_type:complete